MLTDVVERLNTALQDRYRIERELGAGGMATVYLAEDLKHRRMVALKVLKPELAAVVGAERFLAEIRTTANLQHPNILPLFDSGEAGSFLYYVMPYVEGETLRDRLDREKQLPVEEAVRIATEVADALEAAHEQGVIHRDIKPANILLSRGRPLVADFGIALAVSAAGGGRLTETGLSLGTPFYMSPEQASADREPTAASDVYSLGCVLYEMLVGDPPYTGSTAQAVLAKILTAKAPDATVARSAIPPNVDAAIRKALERLPADRFPRAQDFARALADRGFRHGEEAVTLGAMHQGPWKRLTFAAAALAVLAAAVAVWALLRPAPPGPVARFPSPFLPGQEPPPGRQFDISADGTTLVYMGAGAEAGDDRAVWVRRFRDLDAVPLPGTGGDYVSVSPDGREVAVSGFFDGTRAVPLAGGPVRSLMQGTREVFWGADGFVYAERAREGIFRVRAVGGTAEPVSRLGTEETRHFITDLLPGGDVALITVLSGSVAEIRTLDLGSGDLHPVTEGTSARYVDPGYLVFLSESTLFGARFAAGELSGAPVPLVENVRAFRISNTGTLVYAPETAGGSEFVWVDRDGNAEPVAPGWRIEGLILRGFELSPDGSRVAMTADGPEPGSEDIWVKELPDGPMQRLTFDEAEEWNPRWVGTGQTLTYTVGRTGGRSTLLRRADGTGTPDTLFDGSLDAPAAQLGPGGEWLVLRVGMSGGLSRHIAAARVGPDAAPPAMILGDGYNAVAPALSPDGRFLAYASDESGRFEVYVRPFPDVGAARAQISTNGGSQPVWSHGGDELFYVNGADDMMVARLERVPDLRVLARQRLFAIPPEYLGVPSTISTNYDVAADDQRFLMARPAQDDTGAEPGISLVVVQNWVEELKAMVGR